MASDQSRSSVDTLAAKAVIGLPTMWRVVTVIGSVASTIILVIASFAFNLVREEWKELRAEVKEMRHKLEEMPDAATLNRLADDVQDLSRRVGRLENQVNHWDE
jgi:Tfp pilus assembly protein PilO